MPLTRIVVGYLPTSQEASASEPQLPTPTAPKLVVPALIAEAPSHRGRCEDMGSSVSDHIHHEVLVGQALTLYVLLRSSDSEKKY